MAKVLDGEWAEAKRRCRLSADDVKMARAPGLQPRSLIKNIPGPREAWKAPVRDWVRDLYRKRFGTIYLGRLCTYGECPKGKPDCRVPGCGAAPFLKQHQGFVLDPGSFAEGKAVVLFDRAAPVGPPAQR